MLENSFLRKWIKIRQVNISQQRLDFLKLLMEITLQYIYMYIRIYFRMFTMHSWILFTSLHICCSCWKNHGLAWLSPPADWTGSTQHPATGRPSFLYCSILSATWSGNTNDIDRRCFITQQYNHSLPIVFLN